VIPQHTGQNKMEGYTVLERPKRNIARPNDGREFQFFDMKNFTTETMITGKATIDAPQPKKQKKIPKKDIVPPQTAEIMEEKEEKLKPWDTTIIKVFTDITEASIEVVHVDKNDDYICIFMDSLSPTKLKPRKGATLEIEVDGEIINAYSPGVYSSIPQVGLDMVFLLVSTEDNE
jgi:hypothetical protein